ncbi:MAG: DUF6338 family protein [Candidatus Binatia bacterium]
MPSNLQSFLLLLILIAPGFLFTQASAYGRPRYYKEPDLFRQTVSTLIASTVIHTLLLLFLGGIAFTLLRILGPDLSVHDLLKPLPDYPVHELVGYSIILASYSAVSLFLGWRGGLFWQGLRRSEVPDSLERVINRVIGLGGGVEEIPLWWRLIGESYIRRRAEGRETQLKVHLRNGDECTGIIDDLRWVGEKETVFELVLKDVFYVKKDKLDDSASEGRRLPGHRLLLLSSDILWLSRIDLPPVGGPA